MHIHIWACHFLNEFLQVRGNQKHMKKPSVYSFSPQSMPQGESHGGLGTLLATRAVEHALGSAIRHIDQVVLHPGATIGAHQHGSDNEEIYVVISGGGTMLIEDMELDVAAGDIVHNPPNGRHGFVNNKSQDAWLVVIEVAHADTSNWRKGAAQ